MEPSARLYSCACCHQLVVLCSTCDRGNIYCFDGCAEQQRTRSMRSANKTYRNTFNGKRNAARRQSRFRECARERTSPTPPAEEIVTHQGSEGDASAVAMVASPKAGVRVRVMNRCHCCQRPVDGYLRLGFIRHPPTRLSGSFPFPLSE